ncbi:MAG: hydrogenase nickel incorporation protein HypB [Desulfobulbus sp.]|nr:hydrogenase nickel incorporation protein HypB [Desulfobulbus sp.]
MCDTCGCQLHEHHQNDAKVVEVNRSLLEANRKQAEANRHHIEHMGAMAINLISSPGSGKTTLLERTIDALKADCAIGVIEGDIETERDADRIRAKGVPAVQLTTGGACHLDAPMVHGGLHVLEHFAKGRPLDLIFIENVGNLVCPATFDLGEHRRVVLLSTPEGSDKPAKYPATFKGADLLLITKSDLLPHFDFSVDEAIGQARLLKPELEIITLSSSTGDGFAAWLSYLRQLLAQRTQHAH